MSILDIFTGWGKTSLRYELSAEEYYEGLAVHHGEEVAQLMEDTREYLARQDIDSVIAAVGSSTFLSCYRENVFAPPFVARGLTVPEGYRNVNLRVLPLTSRSGLSFQETLADMLHAKGYSEIEPRSDTPMGHEITDVSRMDREDTSVLFPCLAHDVYSVAARLPSGLPFDFIIGCHGKTTSPQVFLRHERRENNPFAVLYAPDEFSI